MNIKQELEDANIKEAPPEMKARYDFALGAIEEKYGKTVRAIVTFSGTMHETTIVLNRMTDYKIPKIIEGCNEAICLSVQRIHDSLADAPMDMALMRLIVREHIRYIELGGELKLP